MEKILWFQYTEKIQWKFVTKQLKDFRLMTDVVSLVGNPTVGGYGLTLTAAKYVIYFSNSYNLEVRQQSEDRAHRYGQNVSSHIYRSNCKRYY